jgi:ribonuclease HII
VGRGCLFGPVVAAAVILPLGCDLAGLRDSKQIRPKERERLSALIQDCCIASAVAEVDSITIDRVNIYQATRLAMLRAIEKLSPPPDFLLIDAMRLEHNCPQQSLIYGDALSLSIAAASVLAKVYRDRLMCEMDKEFPGYGLAEHKGYGTAKHLEAIRQLGPTAQHRKSFAPMRQMQFFD